MARPEDGDGVSRGKAREKEW
ncbi:hypothetical protein CCACVL1_05047 [Corchorus capsularis]|uniref:Uncharacterized protein n=1 Tax=Corchorus capsularis TaxID=210143 RepID=A0A1R3JN95_COCAP|nr:hypothetical protein CCACVL1_05047 [Corchorus capsularis]